MTTYDGQLEVNDETGVITFTNGTIEFLRVTHIEVTAPGIYRYDIVALPHLTSVTTLDDPGSLYEWRALDMGPTIWYPCTRSTITGHRVSDRIGFRPVQTRDYPPWPWWPLELLMRIAARKIGKGKLSKRLMRGIESEGEHQ